MGETREFLFEHVYLGRVTAEVKEQVEDIMSTLLHHFEATPPAESEGDPKTRSVDYVAGMTDRFAIRTFADLAGKADGGSGLLG